MGRRECEQHFICPPGLVRPSDLCFCPVLASKALECVIKFPVSIFWSLVSLVGYLSPAWCWPVRSPAVVWCCAPGARRQATAGLAWLPLADCHCLTATVSLPHTRGRLGPRIVSRPGHRSGQPGGHLTSRHSGGRGEEKLRPYLVSPTTLYTLPAIVPFSWTE